MNPPSEVIKVFHELLVTNSKAIQYFAPFLTIFDDETKNRFGKILHHVLCLSLLPFLMMFRHIFAIFIILFFTTSGVFDELFLSLRMGDHHVFALSHFPLIPVIFSTSFHWGAWPAISNVDWFVSSYLDSIWRLVNTAWTASWAGKFLSKLFVKSILFVKKFGNERVLGIDDLHHLVGKGHGGEVWRGGLGFGGW